MRIEPVPEHVAIIMDGNGRWAVRRGLPRIEGHKEGARNILRVARAFIKYGVKNLTLFAFSTENWKRPEDEVRALLNLFEDRIDEELELYIREGIRLFHIGELDGLSPSLKEKVERAMELTKDNERLNLYLAFNYGGRMDILQATRKLIRDGIEPSRVDEEMFSSYLMTRDIPDPDLIIRTGGELRLSNFFLWQSAYSELYFTKTLWPDFDEREVVLALSSFSRRERRFGKVP